MEDKHKLYEAYWGQAQNLREIAEEYDKSVKKLREWFDHYDIPRVEGNPSRAAWVASQRSKSHYLDLYWGEAMSARSIAKKKGVTKALINRTIRNHGIRIRGRLYGWSPDEAPPGYRPEKPTTPEDESMPENPDPNKYLVDSAKWKAEIYKLYWGYGLPMREVAEHLGYGDSRQIRKKMNRYGIPQRESTGLNGAKEWRPHHGIPPMFEWPDEEELEKYPEETFGGPWKRPADAD